MPWPPVPQGSDLFDPRLLKNVIKMVDVSYGGEAGFNQAIELSAETLGSVKLVQVRHKTHTKTRGCFSLFCFVAFPSGP